MTNSIAQGPLIQIPADVHFHLLRFLPFRTIAAISSVCYHLFQIYNTLAQNELDRIGFRALPNAVRFILREMIIVDRFDSLPRNVYTVAFRFWRGTTREECRALRNSLIYYADHPSSIVLEEEALAARADDNSLATLAQKEQDANRALVLAAQISDTHLRDDLIFKLSEGHTLPPGALLEMIRTDARLSSRFTWGRTTIISRDIALSLIEKISSQKMRDLCYQALAIQDPDEKQKARSFQARNDQVPEITQIEDDPAEGEFVQDGETTHCEHNSSDDNTPIVEPPLKKRRTTKD